MTTQEHTYDATGFEHFTLRSPFSLTRMSQRCSCGATFGPGHWYDTITAAHQHLADSDRYCFGCNGGHVHRNDCSVLQEVTP